MDDEDNSWLFTGKFGPDPQVDLSSSTNKNKWIPFIFVGIATLALLAAVVSLIYVVVKS